jgi:hypothetical protein
MARNESSPLPERRKVYLAIFLAWVLPGSGHVFLGKTWRGVLFGALVFASLGLGLAHDGKLALRDPSHPFLTSLQMVANVGVGPADWVARKSVYGEVALILPRFPSHPDYISRVTIMRERASSGLSIYGTAYLWTAGIMNLLLLFDVWDVGRGRKA